MANIEKLKQVTKGNSGWLEDARFRQENKAWIKHSQKIAIKVLRAIREKGMKQKELALKMGVSPQQINKIIKGKENLTLETISKLENALGIKLIFIGEEPARPDFSVWFESIISLELSPFELTSKDIDFNDSKVESLYGKTYRINKINNPKEKFVTNKSEENKELEYA